MACTLVAAVTTHVPRLRHLSTAWQKTGVPGVTPPYTDAVVSCCTLLPLCNGVWRASVLAKVVVAAAAVVVVVAAAAAVVVAAAAVVAAAVEVVVAAVEVVVAMMVAAMR